MGGRPPKPMELKRATGRAAGRDSGGRKLNELSVVTPLPMAHHTPEPPAMLQADGLKLWNRVWDQAITWLSPMSDMNAIENACQLADAVSAARVKYLATLEGVDARAFVALNKSFTDALASLGFDPVSRSRLGVAEVKKMSALEELGAKRQQR